MARRKIVISKADHQRLEGLLASNFTAAIGDKPYLKALRGELDVARLVEPEDMPPDVVTMNSTVQLRDLDTDEIETYTLVYPEQANIAAGNLSILAPIGTAILGYRIGDVVRWKVPGGPSHLKIEELVFQPERDSMIQFP